MPLAQLLWGTRVLLWGTRVLLWGTRVLLWGTRVEAYWGQITTATLSEQGRS